MKTALKRAIAILGVAILCAIIIAQRATIHKYQDTLDKSVTLLFECENYIDDLTGGGYADTIAEGDAFYEFTISYLELTNKSY